VRSGRAITLSVAVEQCIRNKNKGNPFSFFSV
jgi:hypothetical protein